MKKLVLAGLALVASTLMTAASVETFDLHAPPSVEFTLDADLAMFTVDDTVMIDEATGVNIMQIGHIEGATRMIGQSQGYLGLPVLDVTVNCSVNGEGTPAMITAWLPTPDELQALMDGAAVHVQLLGQSHPPIMVGVGQARPEA